MSVPSEPPSPATKPLPRRASRFSIARLMGLVLCASLAFAALRFASEPLAGAVFLITCAVLALAVVGAVCRQTAERAWWLGFALFGWGYLCLAIFSVGLSPKMLTTALLDKLEQVVGGHDSPSSKTTALALNGATRPGGSIMGVYSHGYSSTVWSLEKPFTRTGHSLLSLGAGLLGAIIASSLFASRALGQEDSALAAEPSRAVSPASAASRTGWRRFANTAPLLLIPLGLLIVGLAARGQGSGWAVAAASWVLALGLEALAFLGAVYGRGRRRAAWVGAALFCGGYLLLLHLPFLDGMSFPEHPLNRLLYSARRSLPPFVRTRLAPGEDVATANERTLRVLERTASFPFREETPLEDVLRYVKALGQDFEGQPLNIYVDPVGLQEEEKTMQSPVEMDLDNVPVGMALRLVLKQLGLEYRVGDGLIVITSEMTENEPIDWHLFTDPYLLAAHCLLAMLAAGVGSLAALAIYHCGGRRPCPTAGPVRVV